MKYNSFLKILTFAFVYALLATSCVKEGPQGEPGENGTNGADGNVSCLECHEGSNMNQIQGEFWMSQHSVGAIAVDYAGAQARCAPCHSHEQFVQVMTVGSVAGDITNPSPWECNTCHGIHESFEGAADYALRTTDPVNPAFDKTLTMDLGGSNNLCAVCHQSRTKEPAYGQTVAATDSFQITSTHYGPHHGAQANVVAGIGFAEIPGSVEYPVAGNSPHLTMASCTGCHMADFGANDFEDDKGKVAKFAQGGHSFIPSMASCNDCHGTNETNFNYGNKQADIHGKLIELRDLLVDLGVVEGNDVDGYHPHVGNYPTIQVQAFFNWIGLEEDRSLGVHNPKYVTALLQNSIDAMKEELAKQELASN